MEQMNRVLLFGGALFIRDRGVGFELHGVVKKLTEIDDKMRVLVIESRGKKTNGFERFKE